MMIKNNSLYNVFIEKIKIESLVLTFFNNLKPTYQDLSTIYDELNAHSISFDTDSLVPVSEDEILYESESLINAIDLVVMSVKDKFAHIETFIKSLYSSFSALISYEGIYIQQSGELVKNVEEFVNNFDAEHVKLKKNAELKEINQLVPEIFNEFDLLPKYDDQEEEVKSIEGGHKVPYDTKKQSSTISDNNSLKSGSGSNSASKTSPENNIETKEETKGENSPTKNRNENSPDCLTGSEKNREIIGASVIDVLERKSVLFQLVKF